MLACWPDSKFFVCPFRSRRPCEANTLCADPAPREAGREGGMFGALRFIAIRRTSHPSVPAEGGMTSAEPKDEEAQGWVGSKGG